MNARKTPLAWKNLVGDPRRLALACAGVGFAAVLMFTQNGFRNALLDSPVRLVDMADAHLIALSTARYTIPVTQRFSSNLLRRANADPDVAETAPLHIELNFARLRVAGHPARFIRVVAVPGMNDPVENSRPWLNVPGLAEQQHKLRRSNTAILDRNSRSEYGFQYTDDGQPAQQTVELTNQQVELVGTVDIGTDFANEGTLLMSPQAYSAYFARFYPQSPLESVDFGLIRLKEGASLRETAARLQQLAPKQWLVLTPQQLRTREQDFWRSQTPVGTIFSIGTIMGFAVGVIICYQILYTNLQDAMPEFATLKAMGYPNRFFIGLVIRQSVYLSVLGFLPAVAVSWVLFGLIENASGLPMWLTWDRALLVLGLTTTMCLVSGLLALRKLLNADPASLF